MTATVDRRWTEEQRRAIDRRRGDLLLDASAGSGKTSVLVERFVELVLTDGVDVGAILTITFTEKAAAELRDRIRERLRALGAGDAARRTETAFISTIHGFCARVLRAHALQAGLDPRFAVLDRYTSGPLAATAFEAALGDLARGGPGATTPPEVVELVAAYGVPTLRTAVLSAYEQLRSSGERRPRLPVLPDAAGELAAAGEGLRAAAAVAAAELDAIGEPGAAVLDGLRRVARAVALSTLADPWPADLYAVRLPKRGAALTTDACVAYGTALERFREAAGARAAGPIRDLLDRLLEGFGDHYEAAKHELSGLDFEDLELRCRDLLASDAALRGGYARRFSAIMVDEFQDTNRVQLELIESIADGNLFTVGDAQQSIYAFRHADVELFRARGVRLKAVGARETLQTNFRTRPEIIQVLNPAFGAAMGGAYTPLRAGREPADPEAVAPPAVELLIADKGADWELEGLAAPWRLAEARALAARVAELVAAGTPPGEIVVLMRATTDMRAYERALEQRGLPTYVIGGRGYWDHPQVLDLVAYLRLLANPRDEAALYGVLASPLVGVSFDGLVLTAAAARACRVDPWRIVRELGDPGAGAGEREQPALGPPPGAVGADGPAVPMPAAADRARLAGFTEWFAAERARSARVGIEELVEGALTASGYDLAMLAMPGGVRRLANVRKLMRLGREHEAAHGHDLRGFLALIDDREAGRSPENREGEAPVEGEGLDAIRLMTIHRAKGLEFPVVCVADLGRSPRPPSAVLRIAGPEPSAAEPGAPGRIGLRLIRTGAGGRESALHYKAIGDELRIADEAEERRLFYVAMTRARERLLLSGAVKFEAWRAGELTRAGGGPIQWIGPALIPSPATIVGEETVEVRVGEGRLTVRLSRPVPGDEAEPGDAPAVPATTVGAPASAMPVGARAPAPVAPVAPVALAPVAVAPAMPSAVAAAAGPPLVDPIPAGPPVRALSYSALADYRRCGYRFYAERVLGLPALAGPADDVHCPDDDMLADVPAPVPARSTLAGGLASGDGRRRGVLAHALLERLDFRRPTIPGPELARAAAVRAGLDPPPGPEELDGLAALVRAFAQTELCARLGACTEVRREQRFCFALDDDPRRPLFVGALDVLAREGPRSGAGDRRLVVDYKTDRLGGRSPERAVADGYATQQLVYALAALHAGADAVQVVHCFLETPERPVVASFGREQLPELSARLGALAEGVAQRRFEVAPDPHRRLCAGCPAEGGLCSWPVELTRRDTADTLF